MTTLLLTACAGTGTGGSASVSRERVILAQNIMAQSGMSENLWHAPLFSLYGAVHPQSADTSPKNRSDTLRIYIEGDGLAYMSRNRYSPDPTPTDPVALRLATADPSQDVIWLARPCQYHKGPHCNRKYWTSHRFAPEVIATYDHVLNRIKAETGAQSFELVGFSGGAAIAVLLTAKRDDIANIRTAAGNIDNAALIAHHDVSPMPHSLNPGDAAAQIADIPQYHFVGVRDEIVPPAISTAYMRKAGDTGCIKQHIVPNSTHTDGWGNQWRALLAHPLPNC